MTIGKKSESSGPSVRLTHCTDTAVVPETIAGALAFSEDMIILLKCVDRNITDVIVPQGVKYIADRAFFDCPHLERVVIPDSVVAVGESAFSQCQALNIVTLPEHIMVIGAAAFRDCTRLESVVFVRGGMAPL